MKRRTIGPAYERSPATECSEWASRNFLSLLSAVICAGIWWFVVDFVIDKLIPLVAKEEAVQHSSQDSVWIAVKVIGAVVLAVLLCKSRAK
jgi:hypothetical protein